MLLAVAEGGEDFAHGADQGGDEFVEERLTEAEGASVFDRAAKDAAKDVVAVAIAGLDAIGDCEGKGADMVCDDAKGYVNGDLGVESGGCWFWSVPFLLGIGILSVGWRLVWMNGAILAP